MHDDPRPARRIEPRQVLVVVAVVLLVWFAATNLGSVSVHFWLSSARAPVVVVIALSAVLGGVITRLAGRMRKRKGHPAP